MQAVRWLVAWRTRWRVCEYVRNSLWIVPSVFMVAAVAMGITFPWIDEHTTATIGISFGPDAARGVLGAIASGMITFTGFVFSILLLAGWFGDRWLLQRFLRDPTTKAALGIFMATFIYALAVLRVVGAGTDRAFVPSNSVSVAGFLLLLSMLMFLRLLTHTMRGLRMAAVLRDLGRDARRVVDRVYPEPAGTGEPEGIAAGGPEAPVRAVPYLGEPGVVQSADVTSLIGRARRAGAVIELVPRFGDLIAEGSALFRVHGDRDGMIDDAWLQTTVATGEERAMRQDPGFAFGLLADISARALSPGTNDPATSVQALDQIELLLRQIANRRLVPSIGRDATGTIRLWYRTPSWADYLSLAIDETRHYGKGSVQVMRRLRALLDDLRASVPEFRRPAVDAELASLDATTGRVFSDSGDQPAAASDRQGLRAAELAGHPSTSAYSRPAGSSGGGATATG